MTRLFLVRHGEVVSKQTFYGQLDVPLSTGGRRQIAEAARVLSSLAVETIRCSDLERALSSARIIGARHGLEPVPDAAFREMNLGILEGLSYDEVRRHHPTFARKRYEEMWSFRFPGGENLQDVADRVRPALERILAAHPGREENVLLVAHNSVNRVIIGDALGLPLDRVFGFSQDFGCINRIDYTFEPPSTVSGGECTLRGVRLVRLNWTAWPEGAVAD